MVSNGLLNTVGLNLIHRPIIRFTFSGRRITLFAPARLVDSWSSQVVEFSAGITRCSRVHIQIVTVLASKMGDIFSLPRYRHPEGIFSFIALSIFVKIPVFPGCHSNFLKSHFVFPKSHLAFQRVLEKLKKPNNVKTHSLLNCKGEQGRLIYNNFEFSSVNDEMNYDIVNDKIRGILHSSKKFNTCAVQISHFSTRCSRRIRRLHKQIKNAELWVWIKRIERQPHQGHDYYRNKWPPPSRKTPIRNWFKAGICIKGSSNRWGNKTVSRTSTKRDPRK